MQDRSVFEHKAYGFKNVGSGDRFIPSRKKLNIAYAHYQLMNKPQLENQTDIFEQIPRAKGVKTINDVLNETINDSMFTHRKIFDFSMHSNEPRQRDKTSAEQGPWPCQPRTKPIMKTPDQILDLPGYSKSIFSDLIDWGKKDVLIAAMDHQIHIWSYVSQSRSTLYLSNTTTSCTFDPSGDTILASTTEGDIHLFDVETKKNTEKYSCADSCLCEITAVAWSPTGKSFISGCLNGRLRVVARGSNTKGSLIAQQVAAHTGRILRVRVAPSARYVASCAVDVAVRVWTWPCLQPYFEVVYWGIPRTVEWHPWCSRLLAVGASRLSNRDKSTPVLATWDVTRSLAITSLLPERAYSIDNLLFSENTGELVASFWIDENLSDENAEPESRLLVLADEERVVDRGAELRGRVRSMIFSPDGTRLGTATSDEDLIIWPFLTNDEIKKKKYRKSLSAIPVLLDTMENGFSIR